MTKPSYLHFPPTTNELIFSLRVAFTDQDRLAGAFLGLFERSAPISHRAAALLFRKEECGGMGDAGFPPG